MAAVTLGASVFTTTAGNKTTASFTPAVGDLLVVVAAATGVTTSAVSDSQSGTYTKVAGDFTGFSTTGNLNVWVRTALVPAATGTTVTATQTSSTGGGVVVYRVSGMSRVSSNAVRSTGGQSTGGAGATPAPVLNNTPLSANLVIGAVANGTNPAALTPRTGYTESPTPDLGYATPTTGLEVMYRNSGETSATITWGGTSATGFASVAIELDISVPVSAGVGSLVLTGNALTLKTGYNFQAGVGALVLTGNAPTVSTGAAATTINAGVGALVFTGQAPTVSTPVAVTTGVGALVLTGRAPTISTPVSITAGVGSLVFTGRAPTIATPVSVTTSVGGLVLTGQVPSVSVPATTITAGVGSLVLTGNAPTVSQGAGPSVITPSSGALFLTGNSPTVTVAPVLISAGLGSLILTGNAPTISTGGEVARVTWAQIQVPQSLELARVTWAQIQVPATNEIARVTWAQILVPEAVAQQVRDQGAGKKKHGRKRRKFVVRLDGQDFLVASESDAEQLLATVRIAADEAARAEAARIREKRLHKHRKGSQLNTTPIRLDTPRATIRRGDRFASEANQFLASLQSEIDSIYRQARILIEMQLLLRKQWEIDEDEALVALLLT